MSGVSATLVEALEVDFPEELLRVSVDFEEVQAAEVGVHPLPGPLGFGDLPPKVDDLPGVHLRHWFLVQRVVRQSAQLSFLRLPQVPRRLAVKTRGLLVVQVVYIGPICVA